MKENKIKFYTRNYTGITVMNKKNAENINLCGQREQNGSEESSESRESVAFLFPFT